MPAADSALNATQPRFDAMRETFTHSALVIAILGGSCTRGIHGETVSHSLVDREVIVVRPCRACVGAKTVSRVFGGEVYHVSNEKGEWVWLDRDAGGWIKRSNVLLIADAVEYFSDKIAACPSGEHYLYRGRTWFALNEYRKAISDLDTAIRRGCDGANCYYDRALAHYYASSDARSLADITIAVQKAPREPAYREFRAMLYREAGKYRESLRDLDCAIDLGATSAAVFLQRGSVLVGLGSHSLALLDFTKASKKNPADFQPVYCRAAAHEKLGEFNAAVRDYEQTIKLHPSNPLAYRDLAVLLATCPDSALVDADRAISVARSGCELCGYLYWDVVEALSTAYAANGEYTEAIRWAEEAQRSATTEGFLRIARCIEEYRIAESEAHRKPPSSTNPGRDPD